MNKELLEYTQEQLINLRKQELMCREFNEYTVHGVKELLSKIDLTPDEMAKYKINIELESGKGYAYFLEVEIQIEFILRGIGFVPGKEKEEKRIEMLKEAGYESMISFWQKAMR